MPLLLVAVLVAAFLIVHDGLNGKSTTTTTTTTAPPPLTKAQQKYAHDLFYVVRPGDSLSSISQRTGVPIGHILAFNHGLDPKLLQTGQRLRIHLHRNKS